MSSENTLEEATELLQQLGLKEYEAQCFVGLTRLSSGTAKQLSEITEVPRTRVYDAIRVLEAQGLVEIQHSSPQQYRAVPLDEATETLRDQYEERIDQLTDALEATDSVDAEDQSPVQEVWSMSGKQAIENRSETVLTSARKEVVLVLGDRSLLTDTLVNTLASLDEDVDVVVGAVTEALEGEVHDAVPRATTFVSTLEWLDDPTDEEVTIGRLVLVDRSTILVSTVDPTTKEEHAVFGGGFKNGLVVIARRLMAEGLVSERDPFE